MAVIVLILFAGAADAMQFKIATVAPEGSQWMTDLKAAAAQVKERTDGRVTFKFYGGGVMGNDKKVLRKVRIGQLHGGVFTANGLAERYRDIQLYGLPMVFASQEEVDYVRERMDPLLKAGLDDAGFVSFGFAGGGFAKLMGNESVATIDQLRGRKVWVPEGDRPSYAAMETLELSPVVLPITDVLTGLQTGLLEYIATPPVGAVVLQWYTKVKYVMQYPFAYPLAIMAIDKQHFGKLSGEDQQVVSEIFTAIYDKFEQQNRVDNEQAENALRSNGLQFVDVDPGPMEAIRAKVAETSRRMAGDGAFSLELLDQMLEYVKAYRSGGGSEPAGTAAGAE
ncbi:MAG: TRAP transporter substrate-binding protein DctP [Gammaproteobacteria bacterium]|nr:TRAP transporter substrate-binding protein DctP [Gammaproteobacteria bacterium]